MRASELIRLIEKYAKEYNLDIKKVYEDFAEIYKNTYGCNIVMQMNEDGYTGMPEYLESRGIVERYVEILNGQIKMWKKGWKK